MKKFLSECAGWYGMIAVLGAYVLVSFGALRPDGFIFQMLNATGAAGLAIISIERKAWQPGALNVVWAAVGVVALFRLIL